MRSLSKHNDDIVTDRRIINNDIIGFTETQIGLSGSTCRIVEKFIFFHLNFNNSEDKVLSLTYGYRNNVAVLGKFDANGVSIFSFKKHDFADSVMLVYRIRSMQMQELFQMLQYLLATNSIDIVAGDFSFDLLKVSENNLFLNHFTEYIQIVNKPTHISGLLIDHVCIKKTLIKEFFADAIVENICFSDHDAIRIVIEKNNVDFQTIP